MKKTLSLLGVTLLCCSTLATTFISPLNVYAVRTESAEKSVNYFAWFNDGYELHDLGIYATEEEALTIAEEMYIGTGRMGTYGVTETTEAVRPMPTIPSTSESESSSMDSTSSSTSESESSSMDSTSSSTSESESSSMGSTSSSTSESESSSMDSTSSSSSESESSSMDSTSSSSSKELKPTIHVSDKTMYTGDKLTEEDILNWATFENADGLKVGFKVIGDPIQVDKLGNTLTEAGIHQIKYYVEGKTRDSENYVAERTITLTVKNIRNEDKISSTTSSDETFRLNTTNPSEKYTKPVYKTKSLSSASTTAGLPHTGETKSPLLTVIGSMTLLASGAYVLSFKRKKSN